MTNLFESVYLINVIERHKIKNKSEFEELVRIVASGIGAPTNPAKLSNTFKSVKKVNISSVTIDRYLSYMQDAFIIEKAIRYDIKGKKYIGSLAKYYFSDLGIRNAILGLRQQEMASLLKINDSFKKIIVVKDDIKPWRDENGILTIGLIDFLMDDNCLSHL